jgi:hypothetical protein
MRCTLASTGHNTVANEAPCRSSIDARKRCATNVLQYGIFCYE